MTYRVPPDVSEPSEPPKRCTRCGLVSPARSERCECGYSFLYGVQWAPSVHHLRKRVAQRSSTRLRQFALTYGMAIVGVVALANLMHSCY